jgi:predicted peptidase
MKKEAISLFGFLLIIPGLLVAQITDFKAKTYSDSEENELKYRILKPAEYDSTKSYPLVLFLHGAGERGSDNYSQLKWGVSHFAEPKLREKYPAFVVAPQVPEEETWAGLPSPEDTTDHMLPLSSEPTQTMKLTLELLEFLQQHYAIDAKRLYVTGLSMGGFGTFDIIQRHPNKFAAAVPICGGGDVSNAFLIKDLPIWTFHGAEDEIVSPEYSRNIISAIRIAGGSPGYTEYPDEGHIGAWVQAYSNPHLYEWLFSKERKTKE